MKILKAVLITAWLCLCLNFANAQVSISDHAPEGFGLIPISASGADSGAAQPVLARMSSLKIPGVSIAVFDRGRIIWAEAFGLMDQERAERVDTATVFQAASISKPVSTTGMFRLVEQHVINPDEDVNLVLRSWKVPDNGFTTREKVTLRRIVTHMAGLSVHGFAGYNPKDKLPTLPQILDGVPPANSPAVRVIDTPGSREIYSGGGFTVLQLLLEEQTGKPFPVLMKELVLRPIGMSQSSFESILTGNMAAHAATGYGAGGDRVDGGHHVYPEKAAAGLWTTPSDLARFMLNIGGSYRGEKGLLKQSTVRTMLTKIPNGGGQGFGIDGADSTMRFRHNGQNAGFSCYAVSFTGTGRGIVIMTNSDQGDELMHEFVRAVARTYHWPPMWHRD